MSSGLSLKIWRHGNINVCKLVTLKLVLKKLSKNFLSLCRYLFQEYTLAKTIHKFTVVEITVLNQLNFYWYTSQFRQIKEVKHDVQTPKWHLWSKLILGPKINVIFVIRNVIFVLPKQFIKLICHTYFWDSRDLGMKKVNTTLPYIWRSK